MQYHGGILTAQIQAWKRLEVGKRGKEEQGNVNNKA